MTVHRDYGPERSALRRDVDRLRTEMDRMLADRKSLEWIAQTFYLLGETDTAAAAARGLAAIPRRPAGQSGPAPEPEPDGARRLRLVPPPGPGSRRCPARWHAVVIAVLAVAVLALACAEAAGCA